MWQLIEHDHYLILEDDVYTHNTLKCIVTAIKCSVYSRCSVNTVYMQYSIQEDGIAQCISKIKQRQVPKIANSLNYKFTLTI